uniref:hypothetical protein n=1 Tax=Roseburia sp. TaxID=2049040 RepID=UPI003FEFFC31
MENTIEKEVAKLQRFGKITKVDNVKKKTDATLYVLLYDLKQIDVLRNIGKDEKMPIVALINNNGQANFRTYIPTKNEKNKEKFIEEVNKINAMVDEAKFYIDKDGDVCCETAVNLEKSALEDIEKSLRNLVLGVCMIILSKDNEDEEK